MNLAEIDGYDKKGQYALNLLDDEPSRAGSYTMLNQMVKGRATCTLFGMSLISVEKCWLMPNLFCQNN